jgi:signal peptidase I
MSPQIEAGDVVVAAPVPASAVVAGQVLVVVDPAQPDRLLVHRVAGRNDDGTLTTKGDANATPDSAHVSPGAVRGLARLRIPAIGRPAYWIGTGQWLAFGQALAVLSLLLWIACRQLPERAEAATADVRHRHRRGHDGRQLRRAGAKARPGRHRRAPKPSSTSVAGRPATRLHHTGHH